VIRLKLTFNDYPEEAGRLWNLQPKDFAKADFGYDKNRSDLSVVNENELSDTNS
jgi:hypothetical protein